jgi:AcrR family transcriptional regulator
MAAKSTKKDTRDRILEAAFSTLRDEGYSGASARAIAARGKFNQALIFYHFGGVDEALLAALDRSTEKRLARYAELFGEAKTLEQMASTAWVLFKEDLDTGHVKVLGELIAAGSSNKELGEQVATRVEPSLAFTRATFDRVIGGSPLGMFIGTEDAAYALAALYLGLELLCNLSGSSERAGSLFAVAGRIAPFLDVMLSAAAAEQGGNE